MERERPKRRWGRIALIGVAAIVGLDAVGVLIARNVPDPKPTPTPSARSASGSDSPAVFAGLAAASLKSAVRDPDSLVIEEVRVTPDTKWACIAYRARNGFGGMNRETVAFSQAGGSQSARAWNRHCLSPKLLEETTTAKSMMGVIGN